MRREKRKRKAATKKRAVKKSEGTRERNVREMTDLMSEVQEDRIVEEILQREDVHLIFNDAKEQVPGQMFAMFFVAK